MKTETISGEPSACMQAPIGDVLDRVSHELAHLACLLDDLEAVIGPLLLDAGRRDADVLHHAQGFDHIGQKLSGLADFLGALAPSASRQWLIDPSKAAKVVTLADLASRLGFPGEDAGSPSRENGRSPVAGGGDCELF